MTILGIDTSTSICKIWLNDSYYQEELNRLMAKNILAFIDKILKNEKVELEELGGICVVAGPGSFTGLRIGSTVANTIADALSIPIISVSGDSGEWYNKAKAKLLEGENQNMITPVYDKQANITMPRK